MTKKEKETYRSERRTRFAGELVFVPVEARGIVLELLSTVEALEDRVEVLEARKK